MTVKQLTCRRTARAFALTAFFPAASRFRADSLFEDRDFANASSPAVSSPSLSSTFFEAFLAGFLAGVAAFLFLVSFFPWVAFSSRFLRLWKEVNGEN